MRRCGVVVNKTTQVCVEQTPAFLGDKKVRPFKTRVHVKMEARLSKIDKRPFADYDVVRRVSKIENETWIEMTIPREWAEKVKNGNYVITIVLKGVKVLDEEGVKFEEEWSNE
jgi:hypothetical protein